MFKIIESDRFTIQPINLQNHQDEVQTIFEASSEFILLSEGKLPSETAAADFFSDFPPNMTIEDKVCLGVFNLEGHLIGIIDLISNYPSDKMCFVGLFLIHPKHRSNKIGQYVFEKLEEHIKDEGFKEIRLAVVKENMNGYNFWKRINYIDVMKQPYKVADRTTEIIVMTKELN